MNKHRRCDSVSLIESWCRLDALKITSILCVQPCSLQIDRVAVFQGPGNIPDSGKFDWVKQWYPLAFIEYLDPKVPHPVELLGKRLVLWRDAQQMWRCFEDKCPHRLAPLSGFET
jgi:hypothetical protein